MPAKEMSGAEEFLAHKEWSGGGNFLKSWRDDGELAVVMHPKSSILALWNHTWFRFYEDKDKEGKPHQKIGLMRFNSMEEHDLLSKQKKREEDGSRRYPPVICPFSLLLEWVREQIDEERINWTDVIFTFEGGADFREIHAGGFTGLFGNDNLSDEELVELKKAKIDVDEAFKENCVARLEYIFAIVKYEEPEDGVMTAVERRGLGKEMKKAIKAEIAKYAKTKTPEKGDPWNTPFVFEWKYDPDGGWDSYSVVVHREDSLPITQPILDALKGDVPDMRQFTEYSNVPLLRASFEEHWSHEVVPPWDEIFKAAEERVKGTDAGKLPTDFAHGASAEADDDSDDAKADDSTASAEEEPIGCDFCHTPMGAKDVKCSGCGAEYDPANNFACSKKPTDKDVAKAKKKLEKAASK